MKNRIIATIMLVMLLVSSVSVVSAEHEFSITNNSTKTFKQGSTSGYSTTPGIKGVEWYLHCDDFENHSVGAVFLKGTDKLASALWCYNSLYYGYTKSHPYKPEYEKKEVKVVWKMRRDNDKKYAKEGSMAAYGTFYARNDV